MAALCYRNLDYSQSYKIWHELMVNPFVYMVIMLTLCTFTSRLPIEMLIWHLIKKSITAMNQVQVLVEKLYGETKMYFKFVSFKSQMKIGLSAVAKTYFVCGLLQNA